MKKIVNFILLFVITFSTLHEYAYAAYDKDTCTVSEYVEEISFPSSHDDMCDIHFEYHQAYLLPEVSPLAYNSNIDKNNKIINLAYNFKTNIEFFIPPIV